MSWWGKVIGGTFWYMLGGPLGALLGAALGHNFDRGLERFGQRIGDGAAQERIQMAFFTTTFSVMGHLAKADGRVSEHEISMAQQVMQQMQLSPEQRKVAITLFNDGKASDFALDEVLDQFKAECRARRNLLQMFLEIQIATVLSDGSLHDDERKLLLYIGEKLGFHDAEIEHLLSMVAAQQKFYRQSYGGSSVQRPNSQELLRNAYSVLGIEASASEKEVKTAYRKLMSQHHPDKLVSKGLPEEMMALATEKTQEIKSAYETIVAARKQDQPVVH